ncbi:phosphoribosylaminoimidazolesuccinocarboxamide synthase [Sulfobacillus harzensis]|uniref:Phosphoribosylaminoimidazole-succinocarboxamide synthase n=1 Tax=Sulfobacillus harzensis TaxID=2729629 RepID=A0A7Y0Q4E7_9FIRM|nr:phosphoribosylaminoimidazolesuccinocarboxamide synthase [Sulfobacillus harzensis]NMP23926.1 phosphoribosylaminoimidazolesuccinocarboxamide synthase [Sulfobacillus harzensis]
MSLIYEGKAKRVYETDNPDQVRVEFKDSATAFNGQKKAEIPGKGIVNAAVTTRLYGWLQDHGIATHFIEQLDDRNLLVDKLTMVQLEVVVRNWVAGSLHQRTGIPEGTTMDEPIIEFYYKNDDLGDPLLNEDHIRLLGAASPDLVARLRQEALRINQVLKPFFLQRGIVLVDFKLEFGWDAMGELKLGDEISPDTCRLWDQSSGERLDKDRFRRDLGRVEEAYQEILKRVMS